MEGAYPVELDDKQEFQWIGDVFEISVASSVRLLFVCGVSPVDSELSISTLDISMTFKLQAGSQVVLPVILSGKKETQKAVLRFSQRLTVPNDDRVLCFKLLGIVWRSTSRVADTDTAFRLCYGKGLIKGQVATVFSDGWLRMKVETKGSRLHYSGILVPDMERMELPHLCANGTVLEEIALGLTNNDYPFLPSCAFEGYLDRSQFTGKDIHFTAVYPSDGQPASKWYHTWVFPKEEFLPLPGKENMRRIGTRNSDWFLFSGASFVAKLEGVVERFLQGRRFAELQFLDWGCGCGRLTRQLLNKGCSSVTGIDIDPYNLSWCETNLAGASFRLVSPDLPTGLPQDTYDLVYAHSVLTHLAEYDQFLWLAEIKRLLKPSGIGVLTVMADISTAIEDFKPEVYSRLLNIGFIDYGWDKSGVDSQKPGFNRRVFHTVDYIKAQWSNFFSIEAVLHGFSDHQTAIIVRKIC
jgi:2-polyprenyl-3-methyl-5-hydroxy-6-metoxy-1,4-benzoquinol methylase